VKEIKRLGKQKEDGSVVVTFRELFEGTDGVFEALLGTLRTAKRHKIVSFDGEVLFQGKDDHVAIVLLKQEL